MFCWGQGLRGFSTARLALSGTCHGAQKDACKSRVHDPHIARLSRLMCLLTCYAGSCGCMAELVFFSLCLLVVLVFVPVVIVSAWVDVLVLSFFAVNVI